jgi:hypothetical protein
VWAPDVYQGAPTPVTAFMASVGKAAAFAAMMRVLVVALPFYRDDWRPIIWVLALLTLLVGSFLAVVQTNVKRMLAYSSISHAGFILVGVEAAGHGAGEPIPARCAVGGAVPDPVLGAGDRLVRRGHVVSPSSSGGDTSSTRSGPRQAPAGAGARRSPCSCSRRPACRSRAGSSPSSV